MGNREQGLRWLDQAGADLKTSKDCLRDENYYASAFFAQQSAEKALKGFLYSKGLRAIITHSVLDLLVECGTLEETFRAFLDHGRELDRHYIGSRYPDFYPSGAPYRYYTEEMTNRCVHSAVSILDEVKRYLRD
jgi:HEPN domain-containing protein